MREAQAVSRLNQANIAVVFDVCRTDAIDYLSMELVDGESLAGLLKKGPLPLLQALDYAIQLAGALVAAHDGGIVHGDLKPTNVMVAANGSVKLLDFGTARAADRAGIQSSLAGTLPYMAPERVRGEGASVRSDVFSFGCVLYEMVTGRRAFSQTSTAATLAALLCEDPAPLRLPFSAATRELQQLISACTGKNPDDRLQNMRDALESLRRIRSRIVPLPPAQRRRYRVSQALAAAACATTVWLGLLVAGAASSLDVDLRPVPLTTFLVPKTPAVSPRTDPGCLLLGRRAGKQCGRIRQTRSRRSGAALDHRSCARNDARMVARWPPDSVQQKAPRLH